MESALLSPSTTTKLKAKESAMKMRFGSPKLQQVLRERCRAQMKERRGQLFNKRRLGLEFSAKDVQDKLTEILRKEFDNLATTDWDEYALPTSGIVNKPLDPEEAIELENEIIAEEGCISCFIIRDTQEEYSFTYHITEQWILEEYEKMSKEELDLLTLTAEAENNQVICPICQKFNVMQGTNYIKCKGCSFRLDSCNNVKVLGSKLSQAVGSHSSTCSQTPGFILIPENGNVALYMVCQTCSLLVDII